MITRTCVVGLAFILFASSIASANLVSITTSASGNLINFDTATVNRDGTDFVYRHEDVVGSEPALIGFDLTAFNADAAGSLIVPDATDPASIAVGSRAALFDTDRALNTGIINPEDATPSAGQDPAGYRLVFNVPIVNSPGVDVIFFEVDTDAATDDDIRVKVTGELTEITLGNWVKVAPATFNNVNMDTLKTRNAGNTGDITAETLALLESSPLAKNSDANGFELFGLGIDLSLLGVAEGASITSLDIRSVGGQLVDPVFAAGLPAITAAATVPEPATASLAIIALGGLVLRRRRAA